MQRRRFLAVAAVTAALALSISGCSQRSGGTTNGSSAGTAGFGKGSLIGVALPQKTSQNWVDAQTLFPKELQAAGFTSQVQFANSGVAEQQSQISALITRGAKVLVVGAIDGSQLGNQLAQARAKGIKIIAYDRLVTNTPNVDYWVTFQPDKVGMLQGESLLKGLEAKSGHKAPWNVELFAGSQDDANAKTFFEGAMKVLQPKIADGTLKVLSGQTTFGKVATPGWDPLKAQSRMNSILTAHYSSAKLDGVLSPNDTIARGLITSIKNAKKPVPPMTGQDSDVESIKLIAQGVQYSTIDKATATQVGATVRAIKDLAAGKPVAGVNGKANNGKVDVPTAFQNPVLVTKDNLVAEYKNDPVRAPATQG